LGQVICTPRGSTLSVLGGSLDAAQRILAILAGLMMIAVALQFFGVLRRFHYEHASFGLEMFAGSLRSLLATPGRAAPLAFGVFNGFLPCPLVYAFTAEAAGAANALQGVLVMVTFGLGTFPAMLLMGSIGRLLAPTWRQRGVWLAGALILLLGLITLGRGILPLTGHMAHGLSAGYSA
jgi:sulfite exporter TauE/SafE